MSEVCKLCGQLEDKQENPVFRCTGCNTIIHISCIVWWNPPGDINGDVFYDYTCSACSATKTDQFTRSKISWMNTLTLVLHHLQQQSYGIGRHGFFHYKTHIGSFVERNWNVLFQNTLKQRKNWMGGLAGVLSTYSGVFFQSGSVHLGETGWWKLLHRFSPGVIDHINLALVKMKAKRRQEVSADSGVFRAVVQSLGYQHLLVDSCELAVMAAPRLKSRADSDASPSHYSDSYDSSRQDMMSDDKETTIILPNRRDSVGEAEYTFSHFGDLKRDAQIIHPSDTSSNHSFHPSSTANYDSDSRSRSPINFDHNQDLNAEKIVKNQLKVEKPPVSPSKTSFFSTRDNSLNPMPWLDKKYGAKEQKDLSKLSEYEELHLLRDVEGIISRVSSEEDKHYLRRFRAKLALRKLKRNRHLPVFDLDRTVKKLAGYSQEVYNQKTDCAERVLDRYQTSYLLDNLSGTVASVANCNTVLIGSADIVSFRSPSSGCVLKPFIRRDTESTPLWLALTSELLLKANKNDPKYQLPPRAPIDYSYVRPHHIAAINNLCAQFFWPGVDLSETLQYPEYSCVVLYKKLVIGFAFLVPNAGHNQAYISFIFTRPEWRRSHIATFMLYHLLQTCTGRDVTLHVSPTNPAIFLYQKFGFKVEELAQNFYEKYFEVSSKDCKHALFLRLSR